MIETTRRSLITGLIALVAAPAIVRAGSLMPIKQMLSIPGPDILSSPLPIWEEGEWLYKMTFSMSKVDGEWIKGERTPWRLIGVVAPIAAVAA